MNMPAKRRMLKEKEKNLEGNDLREGMMAVINIKMSEVEFVGQTKDQLGSASARSAVDAIVTEKMAVFLEENPQVGADAAEESRCKPPKREKRRAKRARKFAAARRESESSNLGGKLTPAQSKDYHAQ